MVCICAGRRRPTTGGATNATSPTTPPISSSARSSVRGFGLVPSVRCGVRGLSPRGHCLPAFPPPHTSPTPGCKHVVHFGCLGYSKLPRGDWFCRQCETLYNPRPVPPFAVSNLGGVFRLKCDGGRRRLEELYMKVWVHIWRAPVWCTNRRGVICIRCFNSGHLAFVVYVSTPFTPHHHPTPNRLGSGTD